MLPSDRFSNNNHAVASLYDIIFKCGGVSRVYGEIPHNHCDAFIINQYDNNITKYSLPYYPINIAANSILYHSKYGLLSIGGYTENPFHGVPKPSNSFYKFSFQDWKWEKLPNLVEPSCFMSSAFIKNENKLIMIDGWRTKMFWLFDFITNKWIQLSIAGISNYELTRKYPGIWYCKIRNGTFIGGGNCYNDTKYVQYFDMIKNECYNNIPQTNYKYYAHSSIWIDEMTHNLLFIANHQPNFISNSMECIDLRIGKKWTILYSTHLKDKYSLMDVLNIKEDPYKFSTQWILH